MASQPVPHHTVQQYLALDRNTDLRSEYIFGEIVPVYDTTPAHALISGNAIYELRVRFSGVECRVYSNSLRVCLDRDNLYAYPDATVGCGPIEFSDEERDTITNPKIVVEVLSPTTMNYDLGKKLRWYWNIPSLTDILLIDQKKVWIEHWFRAPGGEWSKRALETLLDVLRIESANCEIPVADLYAGVEFQA